VGGDTARADAVLLAVTGLGDLNGRAPVLRSGARPGDVVATTGPLGHAAAGLALLAAGIRGNPLVGEHLRPAPPYDAGPEAATLGATAMIDTSDGLLADLGHIARASGVIIDLDPDRLGPDDELTAAALTLSRTGGLNPPASPTRPADQALAWVLTGGEDHSLAAVFPPGTRLPARWRVIGIVRPGAASAPASPAEAASTEVGPAEAGLAEAGSAQAGMEKPRPAQGRAGQSGRGGVVGSVAVGGQPWAQPPGWDHFAAGTPSG
jgi:thiamine-monophosphate kinase